jgi:hypothetical protein
MNIIEANNPEFICLWRKLFSQSELQYPTYQPRNLEFYREMLSGLATKNRSFLVMERDVPFCGLLAMSAENGEVSVYGEPMLFIEAKNIPKEKSKGAKAVFSNHFAGLIQQPSLSLIRHRDFLRNSELSLASKLLLNEGASARPEFVEVIDLTLPEVELYSQLQKSFKSLVNWGKKNLKILTYNYSNITGEVLSAFQALHLAAAGRKTRSSETWDRQLKMIEHNEAFIVLGYMNDELVTAALFPTSEKYCLYGVSASNRDMFDKPLSHCILWHAICHARSIGCAYFEMGERKFQHLPSPSIPTSKEMGISKFKTGFGGKTKMRLDIRLDRSLT